MPYEEILGTKLFEISVHRLKNSLKIFFKIIFVPEICLNSSYETCMYEYSFCQVTTLVRKELQPPNAITISGLILN